MLTNSPCIICLLFQIRWYIQNKFVSSMWMLKAINEWCVNHQNYLDGQAPTNFFLSLCALDWLLPCLKCKHKMMWDAYLTLTFFSLCVVQRVWKSKTFIHSEMKSSTYIYIHIGFIYESSSFSISYFYFPGKEPIMQWIRTIENLNMLHLLTEIWV